MQIKDIDMKGVKTLFLNKDSSVDLRRDVLLYFHDTFSIDEKLYEQLARDEVYYKRADPLRHPLIFYLGHTAVFYINKLNIGRIINQRLNTRFESIFAVGVDEMSWDDLNEANYNWPSVAEVREYRDQVRQLVDKLIKSLPLEGPITWDSPWWAIMMGIEHERIHLETSSVLIRQLPLTDLVPSDCWDICPEAGLAPENSLLPVPGGKVSLGKGDDSTCYGWDNEYGKADYEVQDFKASRYLCSNREYLGFVEAGGYEAEEYWTEEGWAWNNFQKAGKPRFWQKGSEGFRLRTMNRLIPMPWNWPVEVNYLEAKAFCNWKSKQSGKNIRLPMEEEYARLRELTVHTDQPRWEKAPGNINLEYWASSCPVDRFAQGDFFDVIGNVWQWTETPIYGFPGFRIHPYYDDFSTPTFDGRHNLIMGGSWISTGNEALKSARYAFRRHFYQHAGFRYVESSAPVVTHDVFYETDEEVCLAADADWNIDRKLENQYAGSLILAIAEIIQEGQKGRVLHTGCRTGRLSLELSRFYKHVTGLDFSARLIRAATALKEEGYFRYLRKEEGEIESYRDARLEDFDLEELASRVEFWQGDIANLQPKFSAYDLIVVDGSLSRSTNPSRFLQSLHERLLPGGYLVISDDWNWQEEQTLKENWLGGFRKDGEPYSSQDAVQEILGDNFELHSTPRDIWQVQPLSERSFEQRLFQLSIWKLK